MREDCLEALLKRKMKDVIFLYWIKEKAADPLEESVAGFDYFN